jgi:ATP-dependent RNA helicase DOB1
MNSNDLFSFLDESRPEDDNDTEVDADHVHSLPPLNISTQKRKAESPPVDGKSTTVQLENDDTILHYSDNDPGSTAAKRPRMESPKPMVLDDFETEAKREVAASAGLTGGVDTGTRLELRHQVRDYTAIYR